MSTISRAEAGISVPRLDTFLDLIGAAGFGIALLDRQGRPLRLDAEHDRLRDAALRRFPAHLAWFGEPDGEWGPYWWGWHHIAFWPSRENVPAHIFRHRRTLPRFWGGDAEQTREYGRVWDDAT